MAFVLSGSAPTQPDADTCDTGMRHVELPAVPQGETPTVCISPGRATLFNFDTDLIPGSVTVEGSDRFTKVEPGPSTLKLIPSVKVAAGERLRLTVTFQDNAAPTSAAITLVVQAAQAAPLVNVYRQARSAESYEQELAETKAKVRQLTEENTRLRVERDGPGGLTELLASGVMDRKGVPSHDITKSITETATNAFPVSRVTAYRSAARVVVEVFLKVPEGTPPWKPENATLTLQGRKGAELKVVTRWSPEPIAPLVFGGGVSVEAEATPDVTAGTFTLRLWDTSGARTVTINGIRFP
ncbi:DUF2381 family protein [Myxococcus sp. RHSTA-1-4]|uniref:DUF2381 family protein n=1 Tax=Myxococcus sp. RHSTA-1-4 TaxID=2874601 RepID=UPI001CC19F7D|nr:DUF2381 family protein [Myxococcus sp. RHSTA-1-4]MBZ4416096.1 DUF2381 family protein [Myxococcus sp. RHSTA-1-4]